MVVHDLEVVEVEHHEREPPAISVASRDCFLEQPVEAAAVIEAGQRIVPRVVSQRVEAERERAQRQEEIAIEALVVDLWLRIEAGFGGEQLVVGAPKGTASGAEDLAAHRRLGEHDRRVFQTELLDEIVEHPIDQRETRIRRRDAGKKLFTDRVHPHQPPPVRVPASSSVREPARKNCREAPTKTRSLRHAPPW